ncbi:MULTISPECIES: hypothetical protein [Mumia]|uniref:hypothetical protein n=1 Tax=Mumia TaxID=1546255 RepID=UPI00141E0A9C|nr:hypothetical protein [Mumia sp. ZJ430]
MPIETWVTALACGVALVALAAALLAVRALSRLRAEVRGLAGRTELSEGSSRATPLVETPSTEIVYAPTPLAHVGGAERQVLPHERAVVTQEGTVIVLPSEQQVVAATMGRPLVRGAVLSHGLMHALRPESRDRIRGIVRREFRRRRKIRRRAARQAARSASVAPEVPSWPGSTTTPEQEGTR